MAHDFAAPGGPASMTVEPGRMRLHDEERIGVGWCHEIGHLRRDRASA